MKYLIEYYIRVGEYEKAARLIQNKTVKAAILDMGEVHRRYKRQQELLRDLAVIVYRETSG
jgi:hypothetical protein